MEVYSFSDLQQKHLNRKKIFQILQHLQQKILFRVEKNHNQEKQMVWELGQVPTHWVQGPMEQEVGQIMHPHNYKQVNLVSVQIYDHLGQEGSPLEEDLVSFRRYLIQRNYLAYNNLICICTFSKDFLPILFLLFSIKNTFV